MKLNGLEIFDACTTGAEYFNSFASPKEFVKNCNRGDWLLWLFNRTNPESIKESTLAKAHCANTVRHLMRDARIIAAVDTAIKFGNGEATAEELKSAAAAAAASYDYYAAAAYATSIENRKITADICRKYLPIEIWNF